MKTVEEMIAELQRQGPIDEAEFYRAEGSLPGRQLIRSALQAISGEEGWGGERYFGNVLERCGCHPEEGDSSKKVMLLIAA
ncbi:hypothetical protein [Pseudogemmobacter faecipullorum]|uniref:Uncharacterized protein n=1 Tax=Pseudogemmobacter faecipullorum TaxID=2755041 RepID=A0ABS8CRG6_9RHOB|nr:hypothetical protein [Pseudogemmobacter faecipullorum]MCB5411959.1 hypothetical protein [Pseudogemmobacter faecipullorum]